MIPAMLFSSPLRDEGPLRFHRLLQRSGNDGADRWTFHQPEWYADC